MINLLAMGTSLMSISLKISSRNNPSLLKLFFNKVNMNKISEDEKKNLEREI